MHRLHVQAKNEATVGKNVKVRFPTVQQCRILDWALKYLRLWFRELLVLLKFGVLWTHDKQYLLLLIVISQLVSNKVFLLFSKVMIWRSSTEKSSNS